MYASWPVCLFVGLCIVLGAHNLSAQGGHLWCVQIAEGRAAVCARATHPCPPPPPPPHHTPVVHVHRIRSPTLPSTPTSLPPGSVERIVELHDRGVFGSSPDGPGGQEPGEGPAEADGGAGTGNGSQGQGEGRPVLPSVFRSTSPLRQPLLQGGVQDMEGRRVPVRLIQDLGGRRGEACRMWRVGGCRWG